jgi:pimeloyl-ACP methyl ester carboxylesterase
MPFKTIAGEEIFYSLSLAAAGGRNFVLIHGSGGDHSHWPEALRASALADVYGLDLPAHGSSGGRSRTSVEDYADFVQAFVEQLNLKQVTLFGHSLGGAITQILALRQPQWLSAIVLVGTGARLRVAPAILEALLADQPATLDLLAQYAFDPSAPQALVGHIRTGFANTNHRITHGDYTACDRFDIMDQVSRITLPTLIVSATNDLLTPLKYGRYLHDNIPNSTLHLIENAGHMMALEKPREFMEGVTAFFDNPANRI